MERGFLSQKGSRGGRGVKEKSLNTNSMNTSRGMGVSTKSGDTMNEDALVGGAPAIKEGLTPSVVALMMEKDKLSYVEDTTIPKSFPPLSTWLLRLLMPLGRSSYARVMIELRADVELKDNIVVAMPKITREGHYTCNVHVEYEWKPPRSLSCKVFGHIHEECPKNTGAGEKKTVKKPSQTSQGVPVGPKMDFKSQKEYRHVPKKPTASSSGKIRLLDNDGNLIVPTGIVESDSEVEVVFDETANLRIPTSGKDGSDKGYGTNSLLEQWRDSYLDNDDYDPYDDDMYENHDLSEHLQSICDDLDITVRGRKKT
ncbi:hypothetical protein Tco_1163846 [Tanacetum coccineum]